MYLLICLELIFSVATTWRRTEEDSARKRFRSILRLNILLSTINSGGHPTLRWKTSNPPKAKEIKPGYSLLKYVTTILVRNSEIIAAMAHKTSPSPLSAGPFSEPAPYQVNVVRTVLANSPRQSEPASGTVQTDQGEDLPPAVTAVANPETIKGKDPHFKTASPGVNCLEVPGNSHLIRDFNEPPVLKSFLKIRRAIHYHFA
jgi:hypothetical protein